MPQLDITTYFSQVVWLGITYGTFYLYLTKYVLPLVTKILFVRASKHAQNVSDSPLKMEVMQKQSMTTEHMLHGCGHAKDALQSAMTQADTWVEKSTHNVQQKQLKTLHHKYMTHMQEAAHTSAHIHSALKYTMNLAAQHACNMNKPQNTNKTRVFQKAFLKSLFQHVRKNASKRKA